MNRPERLNALDPALVEALRELFSSLHCLTSVRMFGGREDLPNVRCYVERVSKRPAYIKAMQIAGPTAVPPDGP